MSNSLDPDQAGLFYVPDLSPICLQRLSADNTSRQRVNVYEKRHFNAKNCITNLIKIGLRNKAVIEKLYSHNNFLVPPF